MDSVSSTLFLPFRPSGVSENQIKQLSVYNAQERLESSSNQEQMASRNLANAAPGSGLKAADINSFTISIASGESLAMQFTNDSWLDGFRCRAVRHRNAKLFLVDDPEDKRVKKAARTVCRGQSGVFALTNEVRSLASRVRSLQALPFECGDVFQAIVGIDRDDLILSLALEGFYLQDGFIRCNGCQYRKELRQFAHLLVEQIYKKGTASIFSVLAASFGQKMVADHNHADCLNGGQAQKTLFRISHGSCGRPVEHEHYALYHDELRNHFAHDCDYSVPMTMAEVKKAAEIRMKKDPDGIWGSSSNLIDQYLHHDKMSFLFTTAVPKSQFFTQDDLLYEASTIKPRLDTLRERYGELKELLDRFAASHPGSAKPCRLPRVDTLLSEQIGKVYHRIVVKMAEKEAKALPCHDKAGLQRLLDHLLAIIEHSAGTVAERGLRCLAVQPDQQKGQDFLQYSTQQSTDTPADDSDELTKIQHQLSNFTSDYAQLIICEVLAPLLEIFNPFELNHDVLRKVFGVGDAYIASLVAMPEVSLCSGAVPGKTTTNTRDPIDSLPVLRRRKECPSLPPTMEKTTASQKSTKKDH